jgi:hypothetical protein
MIHVDVFDQGFKNERERHNITQVRIAMIIFNWSVKINYSSNSFVIIDF